MLLHSQHHFRCHNSHHSLSSLNLRRLPVVVFRFWTYSRCRRGVLHRIDHCTSHHRHEYCSYYIFAGIIEILLRRSTRRWKPRSHRRPHAPPKASVSKPTCHTRRPQLQLTSPVTSSVPRQPYLTLASSHLLTSAPRHLVDVIR